jgi:hypothetical protein
MEHCFLFTGCWSKNKCQFGTNENGVSSVMTSMDQFVKRNNVDFIVMGGDNYYPEKINDVIIENDLVQGDRHKPQYNEKEITVGKKIIRDDLVSGFTCLANIKDNKKIPIPIIVLHGNHDLDADPMLNEHNNMYPLCSLTRMEKGLIQRYGFNLFEKAGSYQPFKNVFLWGGKHIIITLDTSMFYEPEDLFCYNKELGSQYEARNLINIQINNILKELFLLLAYKNDMKHIYIMGHHPLIGTATKKDKNKIESFNHDTIYKFLLYVHRLFSSCSFFYLCADIHNYQCMDIQISYKHTKKQMNLVQYIVGTGGTDMDKNGDTLTNYTKNVNDIRLLVTHRQQLDSHYGYLAVSPTSIEFIPTIQSIIKVKKAKDKSKKGIKVKKRIKSKRNKIKAGY